VVLKSSAIGSCVAVVAYDAAKKAGAMAHIMLPGQAPAGKKGAEKTKYAANAIDAIVSKMARLGSTGADIKVAVLGGGKCARKARRYHLRKQHQINDRAPQEETSRDSRRGDRRDGQEKCLGLT